MENLKKKVLLPVKKEENNKRKQNKKELCAGVNKKRRLLPAMEHVRNALKTFPIPQTGRFFVFLFFLSPV